ncbi:DnaJ-domain-containing protein [Panus rudis PR-1116 ss-1]|nr:DnaJ-domain-containing protein [Panus rudis PR-1116 ss-1]
MASVVEVPVVTPPLPSTWTAPQPSGKGISPVVERRLLPAGPAYLAHVRRAVHNLSFEEHDKHAEEERKRLELANGGNGANGEDDLGVGDEEETEDLLSLDPKEWKKQDHYAVLGLSHLRYKATPEQIKIAHRKKVLKHHPDKKAGAIGDSNDDAFFKCIQKAFEVLTNPERRRQFDSVDPYYELLEADVPTAKQIQGAKDPNKAFFDLFGPVFEREARFSKKQPVPLLGSFDDSKETVESFYDFWYNFDSWRSFEYLDKEVNEGSDNRDDKRYTEKKNKSERARRKKEDTARLRSIVDLTLSLDPRIKRIKQEEKAAREAKKKGKTGAVNGLSKKQQEEEEKKRLEEEAKRKEEEEKVQFTFLAPRGFIGLHSMLCTFSLIFVPPYRLLVPKPKRRKPPLPTLLRKLDVNSAQPRPVQMATLLKLVSLVSPLSHLGIRCRLRARWRVALSQIFRPTRCFSQDISLLFSQQSLIADFVSIILICVIHPCMQHRISRLYSKDIS